MGVVVVVVGCAGSVGHGPGVHVILTFIFKVSSGTVPLYLMVIILPAVLPDLVIYKHRAYKFYCPDKSGLVTFVW